MVPYALKDKVEQELQRLEEEGIIYKVNQSEWAAPVVLVPKKDGSLHPTKSPTNVTELKSYLGLLNYYDKFVPELATILRPLHDLLQKDAPWKWTEECERAFVRSKEQLQASPLLVHYDLKKPLRLACDTSAYDVDAVISHVMENDEERPIAFASRTLSASELAD
ncbi:hypothetical protein ACROYT_G012366 [Oculina patagonica]